MEELVIKGAEDTPYICFNNNGLLTMSGRLIPENATEFFSPVINWLTEYVKQPAEITYFNMDIDYFNTVSAKKILDILLMFGEIANGNQLSKVLVKWKCNSEDDDLKVAIKEFSEIAEIPIEIIH